MKRTAAERDQEAQEKEKVKVENEIEDKVPPSPSPSPSASSSSQVVPVGKGGRASKKARVAMSAASTGTLRRVANLSAAFTSYYRDTQKLTQDEAEWQAFHDALQRELPTSFRITAMGPQRALVQRVFELVFLNDPLLQRVDLTATLAPPSAQDPSHNNTNAPTNNNMKNNINVDNTTMDQDQPSQAARVFRGGNLAAETLEVAAPSPVPWYLDGASAYTYSIARNALRRNAKLKQLKRFLAVEDEAGHVSGQELVSMLPGVVLDVQSHHSVLDMCAAPGSKSGQLLEALHVGLKGDAVPSGFVMSNELDVERAYMLTHRVQRLGSPSMLVVNYAAQLLPTCTLSPKGDPLLFDRVLADVPCSGDGTMRKAPHLAPNWDGRHALDLHKLQLDIARRGVELLAVGGRMVYSTCSLNPIENEAVVSALLSEFGPCLELVEVRASLFPLQCRPGLDTWTVFEQRLGIVSSYEALDKVGQGTLQPTMFAPKPELIRAMHMDRCLRLHPHDNDSGGFFVAVLHKVAATGREGREVTEAMISDAELEVLRNDEDLKARLGYPRVYAEAPYVPLSSELMAQVRDEFGSHFGLEQSEFSTWASSRLLVRADSSKTLSLCTPRVRDMLVRSAEGTLFSRPHSLKVVNAGVRVLQNDSQKNKKLKGTLGSHVRLAAEGARFLAPRLTKQCAILDMATFELLLALDQGDTSLMLEHVSSATVRAEIERCAIGPMVVVVRAHTELRAGREVLDSARYALSASDPWALVYPAWRGSASVRLNVSKTDLKSLRNLFLTDSYDYDLTV